MISTFLLLLFLSPQAHETTWRQPCGSLNYVETSTWTRQEHNGFSHQNPSFIGSVLNLKPTLARVYLPPDANCFLSTVAHCLRAKDYINLMVGSKQPTPVWLSPEEADKVSSSLFHGTQTDGPRSTASPAHRFGGLPPSTKVLTRTSCLLASA